MASADLQSTRYEVSDTDRRGDRILLFERLDG